MACGSGGVRISDAVPEPFLVEWFFHLTTTCGSAMNIDCIYYTQWYIHVSKSCKIDIPISTFFRYHLIDTYVSTWCLEISISIPCDLLPIWNEYAINSSTNGGLYLKEHYYIYPSWISWIDIIDEKQICSCQTCGYWLSLNGYQLFDRTNQDVFFFFQE